MNRFLQGAELAVARQAQLKPLPTIFQEGGREYQQHWRSSRVAIYSRSGDHDFYLYEVIPVRQVEERDQLLAKSPHLDSLIDQAAKWEREQ